MFSLRFTSAGLLSDRCHWLPRRLLDTSIHLTTIPASSDMLQTYQPLRFFSGFASLVVSSGGIFHPVVPCVSGS